MKQRIITRFQGGLGNQFFIYCASLALNKRYGIKGLIDNISGYRNDPYKRTFQQDLFTFRQDEMLSGISSFILYNLIRVLKKLGVANNRLVKRITEDNYRSILEGKEVLGAINYLDGYFQYWDVPDINRSFLFDKFDKYFRDYLEQQNAEMQRSFMQLSAGKYIICHVRRQNYERLDMAFYINALEEHNSDLPVCFISDDIEWVMNEMKNYRLPWEVRFAEMKDAILELYLIVRAESAIISVSTFSWLGAWLSCIRRGRFDNIYYPAYKSNVIASESFLYPEWEGITYEQAIEDTTL